MSKFLIFLEKSGKIWKKFKMDSIPWNPFSTISRAIPIEK